MYSPLLLLTCLGSLHTCALGTSCITLLTNEFSKKTSTSETAVTCSKSNLKILQNTTTCFPLHSNEDVEEYISWYSRVTETVNEYSNVNSTSHSQLFLGVSSSLANSNKDSDFVNRLLIRDPKTMTSALLAFVNYNKWKRVAFITHLTNKFYLEPIQQFYKNLNSAFRIHLSQILGIEKAIDRSLKRIKKLKYRVIIVSLPEETLRVLLCRTIGLGMTWPNYIWVIVNSDGSRFYEQNPCLDQVTVFQLLIRKLPVKTMSTAKYERLIDLTYNTNYPTLCYSHVKYSYSISISTWKEDGLKLIANYTPADGLSSVNLPFIPGEQSYNLCSYFTSSTP